MKKTIFRLSVAAFLLVSLIIASGLSVVQAQLPALPTEALSSSEGIVGSTFTVTGTNWHYPATITIKWVSPTLGTTTLGTVEVASDKTVSAGPFTVPDGFDGNAVTMTSDYRPASWLPYEFTTLPFLVDPHIEISPAQGPPDTSVHVAGTGFLPSVTPADDYVTITFGGELQTTVQVEDNGIFSADFTVPIDTLNGLYKVVAANTVDGEAPTAFYTVTGDFLVVPEYLFGGLAALAACFAGFVLVKRKSLPKMKVRS